MEIGSPDWVVLGQFDFAVSLIFLLGSVSQSKCIVLSQMVKRKSINTSYIKACLNWHVISSVSFYWPKQVTWPQSQERHRKVESVHHETMVGMWMQKVVMKWALNRQHTTVEKLALPSIF